jgi:hypothetical protein
MATTIHAGDHTSDCVTCQKNCECQRCRITENMKEIDWEEMSFDEIADIFEDADPTDYL